MSAPLLPSIHLFVNFLTVVNLLQDVALLDRLIKEDVDTGKLPLLLIANAGQCEI